MGSLHRSLQEIADELESASARLEQLASSLDAGQWALRPDPDRWSPLECIAHLNLTGDAFVPKIRDALARTPAAGRQARYRRDFFGWLLWKTLPPPVRFRTKTAAGFVPTANGDHEAVLGRFRSLQKEQLELVERSDGLQIDRVKIESPFDPRIRYNLYSALSILPRHQHRHLWQAEQAVSDRL